MRDLLILHLGGTRYGVWGGDVRTSRAVETIHRLPLSPDCISGMSIIDDRTVMLADLAACIGLPRTTQDAAGHILLGPEEDRTIGLVVRGDIDRLSIPAGGVFPLPEYLKTSEIDTCVVDGCEPIPVINVSRLFERIRKAEYERPVAGCAVPSVRRPSFSSIKRVRLFKSGGELFCAPAHALRDGGGRPDGLSRLAYLPRYIEGISSYEGTILPVIHLARKMQLPEEGSGSSMLVAGFSRQRFGCLVDAGGGTLPRDDFSIAPLPPLVASGWMRAAVVHAGEIFPVVELAALLSSRHGARKRRSPPKRNAPRPQFPSAFGKEGVEVVEFSLLGARHALPAREVEATLAVLPYRKLWNLPPVVVGVAEHGGELLPVLDLAMCFGKRSKATPEWRMILARNGDFRALVITEAVFGERHLPVDMQRALPIALPHGIVYGCYPDESRVKLILNVESLAVHSEETPVREVITTALQEMQQAPAEILPSLFASMAALESGEPAGAGASVESPGAEERAGAGDSAEPVEATQWVAPIPPAGCHPTEETGAGQVLGVTGERGESEGPAPRVPPPATGFLPQPGPLAQPEAQPDPAVRHEWRPEPQPIEPEQPAGAAAPSEPAWVQPVACEEAGPAGSGGLVEDRAARAIGEPQEPAGIARPERPEVERATPRGEAGSRGIHRRTEEPDRVEGVKPAGETFGEEHEEGMDAAGRRGVKGASGVLATGPEVPAVPQAMAQREIGGRMAAPTGFRYGSAEAAPVDKRRSRLLIAGVAAAMIAGAYALSVLVQSGVDTAGKPERAETAAGARPGEPKASARKPGPGESSMPVILHPSQGAPPDPRIYKVRRGDTLWSISKRFTGNPLNYPHVARENKISDPDVIFPGQKIRLKGRER